MFRKYLPFLMAALLFLIPAGVSAAEVDGGSVYCFRPEDFGEDALTGICLTEVPTKGGTVLLGDRVLRPGDVLTAEQAACMTFAADATETDAQVQISYLPIFADCVAEETTVSLAVRGREDQPPVAEDSALETYKNLANTGKLKVHDPEGMPLTITISRQPRRGTVEVQEDGTFTYTPKNNKVGVDSFTYTASDPAGKVSREATVTVTILKPSDSARYTDTAGKDCCFAAEWMRNTGIFTGEALAGNACFSPEKPVTRGEFVSMLVKTLEIPVDEELTYTGYVDEVPGWLKPYLAAAIRSGMTARLPGTETFGQAEAITGSEAAALLCCALDLKAPEGEYIPLQEDAPTWAEQALAAANGSGFALDAEGIVTRGQAAVMLYQAKTMADQDTGKL